MSRYRCAYEAANADWEWVNRANVTKPAQTQGTTRLKRSASSGTERLIWSSIT